MGKDALLRVRPDANLEFLGRGAAEPAVQEAEVDTLQKNAGSPHTEGQQSIPMEVETGNSGEETLRRSQRSQRLKRKVQGFLQTKASPSFVGESSHNAEQHATSPLAPPSPCGHSDTIIEEEEEYLVTAAKILHQAIQIPPKFNKADAGCQVTFDSTAPPLDALLTELAQLRAEIHTVLTKREKLKAIVATYETRFISIEAHHHKLNLVQGAAFVTFSTQLDTIWTLRENNKRFQKGLED